jgi:hypothetical protein
MPVKSPSRRKWTPTIVATIYLILALVVCRQLAEPRLAFFTAILLALQAPAWLLTNRLRVTWLPLILASGFVFSLAALLHRSLGTVFDRPYIELGLLSALFAAAAIVEGARALRLAGGPGPNDPSKPQ